MKDVLVSSYRLYTQRFGKVFSLSLLVYFPLLFLHALIVNYIYMLTRFAEYPGLIGDVANGLFMLIFLTIGQLPFIKFVMLEEETDGEESTFRKSLSFTLEKIIPFYLFACIYAVLVTVGSLFYVIPGLAILFLFYFVPYFIADWKENTLKIALIKSMSFIKKHIFKAPLVILGLTVFQFILEQLLIQLLFQFTDVYFMMLMSKIFLLLFILPFQTIVLTYVFRAWRETT
ncbi:hypothetical protein [Sporosarcina sp. FSL K6-3457]|uniref:hypothetical protein n=1 Tax=Sporosarcina sp. FSL K6-3457 TaxID=2978204 RepID=UPI0030F67E53